MPEPESKIGQIRDLLLEQRRQADPLSLLRDNWFLIAAIISAALFIGKLDQRVATLEQQEQFLHGDIRVPGAK